MPTALCLIARSLVTATLFVAMTAVGMAHRTSSPPTDPDLIAFLDAGGTLDALCGLTGGTPHGLNQNCEACRLINAIACPPLSAMIYREAPARIQRMRVIAQLRHYAKPLDPAQLTRAPPQA